LFTSLVSLQRSQPQNTVSDSAWEKATVLREADKENYSSAGHQCQKSPRRLDAANQEKSQDAP